MYDPRKDISRNDAEEAIKEVFEGYAGEMEFPPETPYVLGSFQQCDEQEPLDVTTRTFEAHHYFAVGKGETLGDAVDEFVMNARFPWPSIKNRFTIAFRRKPEIKVEQDFATNSPLFSVTARYALILDYEPFDKEKPR